VAEEVLVVVLAAEALVVAVWAGECNPSLQHEHTKLF
jgi:hypothetical protein